MSIFSKLYGCSLSLIEPSGRQPQPQPPPQRLQQRQLPQPLPQQQPQLPQR